MAVREHVTTKQIFHHPIEVQNSDGTRTEIDLTELAAIEGIAAADLAKIDGITNGTVAVGKAIVPTTDKHIDALVISDGGLALGSGAGTAITATAAELNYNDIATLGTLAASKTWTSDASLDTIMPTGGKLTVQSGADITLNSGATFLVDTPTTTTVAAAEHGAGAIGTAATPKTRRWTERGVIVTQTTFDLTGLASGGTANDIVGLAAGGAAYIGRNVVATNGVIFKMELSCLETPVTGDGDIDIVADTSAALVGNDAYTGAIKINGGTLVIGQTVQNLVPAVDANFYFYIAAVGAGGGTYTAGMFVLTTYGHAVLA